MDIVLTFVGNGVHELQFSSRFAALVPTLDCQSSSLVHVADFVTQLQGTVLYSINVHILLVSFILVVNVIPFNPGLWVPLIYLIVYGSTPLETSNRTTLRSTDLCLPPSITINVLMAIAFISMIMTHDAIKK